LEFLGVELKSAEDCWRDLRGGDRGRIVAMADTRARDDQRNVAVGGGNAAVFGDLRRLAG
jgi:hypothetical protein